MRRRKMQRALALVVVALALMQSDARAYADPGSGALVWQMALAAFFACLFHIRRLTNWVSSLLRRRASLGNSPTDAGDE
jgi:uncharacterized membrane protein